MAGRLTACPRPLWALGLLLLWPLPPAVDPQLPGSIDIPDVRDSLRLVNILIRRPIGPMSERRECRMLNSTEFERITGVINRAKRDTRIRPNVYDAFAYLHAHPEVNAGAHQGPGFLPFHRVLVFLFEKLMRMYDPTVSLCFWDSTLEPSEMQASASWTSSLFGNNQGNVFSGFAGAWMTPLGALHRNGGRVGRPFQQQDIRNVLRRKSLGEISFPGGNIESNVEEKHNYVHTFVGGLMGQVETASYDPIFWFHHTFIDCIYEWFRQSQLERGINPMRDWPKEYGDYPHSPFAAMRLGRLRMIDGANKFFTERAYKCMEPPGACDSDLQCGNYMRCDPAAARCVSDTMSVSAAPSATGSGRGGTGNDDLRSLLGQQFRGGISSINNLLTAMPTRGFSSLFQMPSLDSLNIFSSSSSSSSRSSSRGGVGVGDLSVPTAGSLLAALNPPGASGGISGGGATSARARPSAAANLLTGLWNNQI